MTEISGLNPPLDTTIMGMITHEVGIMKRGIEVLLEREDEYKYQLGRERYDKLMENLDPIRCGISELAALVSSPHGGIAHDANNKLTPIIGRANLLSGNELYRSMLSPDVYAAFTEQLNLIEGAALRVKELFVNLGGIYKAKEQKVAFVDGSQLGLEEVVYRIVHIDDSEDVRKDFTRMLSINSNIVNPVMHGFFGHDGKKVKYEVHSYGSVMEALNAMPKLGDVDLLITDREMPNFTGLHLLYAISQLPDSRVRESRYKNVKNVAMLSAGITPEEAKWVAGTYGAVVMNKDFEKPLALEQQIYHTINRKAA